jgi:predicted esterase
MVVPYTAFSFIEKRLKELGFDVDSCTCHGLAHSISDEGLQQGVSFLKKHFI